jgi:hypothetical protein
MIALIKVSDFSHFGVPLVERLDVQELLVVVGSGGDGVDLRSDDELDVVTDIPLAVLVGDRGHFAFVAFDERVLVFESVAIFVLVVGRIFIGFY